MLRSRTMAVAGTIAALSLAAAPIASASIDTHSGKPGPVRIQRVDKRSPDKTISPDRTNSHDRNAQRDSTNTVDHDGRRGGQARSSARRAEPPTHRCPSHPTFLS